MIYFSGRAIYFIIYLIYIYLKSLLSIALHCYAMLRVTYVIYNAGGSIEKILITVHA